MGLGGWTDWWALCCNKGSSSRSLGSEFGVLGFFTWRGTMVGACRDAPGPRMRDLGDLGCHLISVSQMFSVKWEECQLSLQDDC